MVGGVGGVRCEAYSADASFDVECGDYPMNAVRRGDGHLRAKLNFTAIFSTEERLCQASGE
jgi:hypothetical protein